MKTGKPTGRPRTPVFGVGINDLPYKISEIVDGKQKLCPFYSTWKHVIERSFSEKRKVANVTYDGVSCTPEWILATTFKTWMESQIWEGLHLDKDILKTGNKLYSPDTCVFVPQRLNKLLLLSSNDRGDYPVGASLRSNPHNYNVKKPFVAQLTRDNGKVRCLGYFYTAQEAHRVWQWEKAAEIESTLAWYATQACFRTDVAEALTSRVWRLRLDHANNAETKIL